MFLVLSWVRLRPWGILHCCFYYASMLQLATAAPFVLLFVYFTIHFTFNVHMLIPWTYSVTVHLNSHYYFILMK